ncbi:MAG: DedA family protein [Oceanospirillaceae bacterium]|nr:DedA family protein [Oceanospirillaceae bacterium]
MALELWGLFASSFIASTLFPGGSEALLLWLLSQQQISVYMLLGVAITGNSLGGIVTLVMGRIIAHYYPAKKLGSTRQLKAQQWLMKRGSVVLLLSWLPLIGDPLCLLAGWLKLNVYACIVFLVIGKAVRYLFLAVLMTV